jgi:predicted nucleic acid-binding protein
MTPSRRPNPDRRIVPGSRVIFDTATLLSAALRSSSAASRAFSLALTTGVVCSSEPDLDQLASVLARRTLDRYMSRRARAGFVSLLRHHAWLCPAPSSDKTRGKSSRHAQQTKDLIAFAAAVEADALVTSTPRPLARSSRRSLPILTPEEFLSLYPPA